MRFGGPTEITIFYQQPPRVFHTNEEEWCCYLPPTNHQPTKSASSGYNRKSWIVKKEHVVNYIIENKMHKDSDPTENAFHVSAGGFPDCPQCHAVAVFGRWPTSERITS